MSHPIIHELCQLTELWGYLIVGLIPFLICAYAKPNNPVLAAISLHVSRLLMEAFTPRQLFWRYSIAGTIWFIGSKYHQYLTTARQLGLGTHTLSFRRWCGRVLLTAVARVDVLKPPRVKRNEFCLRGRLTTLTRREGKRPAVKKLIPDNQLDQKATSSMIAAIKALLFSYRVRHPDHLHTKWSKLDLLQTALFWNIGQRSAGAIGQREEWHGEIAHVHEEDGSVHVVLHPEDVAVVINAGFGERHPLCANEKRWFRLLHHGFWEQPLPVPEGLVLIYAPRNQRDLQALTVILEAAIWYATQKKLYSDGADPACALCRRPQSCAEVQPSAALAETAGDEAAEFEDHQIGATPEEPEPAQNEPGASAPPPYSQAE